MDTLIFAGSMLFLSTLSLRRATNTPIKAYNIIKISIHALLAESDGLGIGLYLVTEISIHALLAESDRMEPSSMCMRRKFLSTLSLRRATVPQQENGQAATISIHALLAESDGKVRVVEPGFENISIHALLAESDIHQ